MVCAEHRLDEPSCAHDQVGSLDKSMRFTSTEVKSKRALTCFFLRERAQSDL